MKVINKIGILEINGQRLTHGDPNPDLIISSHWNYTNRVILKFPNGDSITVLRRQLEKAISNACNHEGL